MQKSFLIIISFLMMGLIFPVTSNAGESSEKAILAGGCFWCLESDFQEIPGVKEVVTGYIGGEGNDPTYKDYGKRGFIEAIELTYDSSVITYKDILELFWLRIDPVDEGGQFCDRGHEYSAAIFYNTEEQKRMAEESKSGLEESGLLKSPIATKIIPDNGFFQAETYHQDYYKNKPLRYRLYRYNCGRDQRLKELWGVAPSHG